MLKCVALIEAFIGGPRELSLTELGRLVGQPLPTVHRMLATLEYAGWVDRGPRGGYALSLRLAAISHHVLGGISLRDRAREPMQHLSLRTGETSYLVIRDGDQAVCVERVESSTMVRVMSMDVGSVLPLWVGAAPLALLAHLTDAEQGRILAAGPFARPAKTALDRPELATRLARIRELGHSLSSEETTPGIASIGAPVFERGGVVAAGLSVGGLASSLTGPRRSDLARAVMDAAATISASMGHQA